MIVNCATDQGSRVRNDEPAFGIGIVSNQTADCAFG
jgi:hypothetical protein